MNKNFRTIIVYMLILAGFTWLLTSQVGGTIDQGPVTLATGEFVSIAKNGRIQEVEYRTENGTLSGTYWKDKASQQAGEKELKKQEDKLKAATTDAEKKTNDANTDTKTAVTAQKTLLSTVFDTAKAPAPKGLISFKSTWAGSDSFTEFAQKNIVGKFTIDNTGPSIWVTLLPSLLTMALIIGVMFFFFRQMGGGGGGNVMSFGKAKAKRSTSSDKKVTFKDVAGADEAVQELEEIKDFLANPERYQKLGAKIPKGVLLVGPPGTGKTLLARAVAGEANVPFFTISGSDFVEMFVGVGASRVRDLFEQAKAESPSIIFVDEIDAVGRRRGAGLGGGHDEREQTLNQMLVEMDGFGGNDNVIMIAATNRPDILDPALLRPGRFDRQIVVDRPDLRGREQILKIHSRNKPLADDIDLSVLARRTPGFTGADLANIVNEAALLTARHNKTVIEMQEFEEGIDRVVAGPERKSRLISEHEKKVIAYHEAGHALVGHMLPNADPVHKVTIIPRGQSLGSTWQLPGEDRFLESKKEMLDDIAVLLSGRAAEEIAIGDITTGASNDIERATKIAKAMVTRYGMSTKLGPQTFGDDEREVFLGRDLTANADYGTETARVIDAEIAGLINQGFERAHSLLNENRNILELMVNVLMVRETLDGEALIAVFENRWDQYLEDNPEFKAEIIEDEKTVPASDVIVMPDAPEKLAEVVIPVADEPVE